MPSVTSAACAFALVAAIACGAAAAPLQYRVNLANATAPWTKYFLESVGSGHATLALRKDYSEQLAMVTQAIPFKRVRMHGIFVDDMSAVLPGYKTNGLGFYFFNHFKIYDDWLSLGVRPIVELSFMPGLLASGNATWSHYNARIDPPKNMSLWSELVASFAQALVDRYGIEEVSNWYFETWNEPNCCGPGTIPPFWTGGLSGYLALYNATALALKSVSPRLKVGGPASSALGWLDEFLAFTDHGKAVPMDFVSSHIYPTDPLGPQTRTLVRDALTVARGKVGPDTPFLITEIDDAYNSATSYSAAFIFFQSFANNGIVDLMSWWPWGDLFEEGGLYPVPFDASGLAVDGLVNVYGIPKPSFRAFELLGWSGDTTVDVQPSFFSDPTVAVFAVTGNSSHLGAIYLTNWQVATLSCPNQMVTVTVTGLGGRAGSVKGTVFSVDGGNGNAYDEWQAMGSPFYLKPADVQYLTEASLVKPVSAALTVLDANTVSFTVPLPGNTVAAVFLD